jgi:hypothetical protein
MRSRLFLRVASLACFCILPRLIASGNEGGCAVTKQPNPPFSPPAGYDKYPNTPEDFMYGTDLLWTVVRQHTWRAGGNDGAKLPYYRRGYDMRKPDYPGLAVVARRVDAVAPLVWAGKGVGISLEPIVPPTKIERMAMLTAIDIPTAGCWEISAHYADQSLTYTILVRR